MKHMNKKNPFKVPEGYMDSLKGRILEKVASEEVNFPKDEGFGVPENYFDSLGEKLKTRLPSGEPKVIKINSYRQFAYVASAVAAVFLLVFVLQYKGGESPGFDTLASAEIEQYLNTNVDALNTYELAEELGVDQLGMGEAWEENLEEENIIDYLDEEIDDLDDLNFELDE